MIKAGKKGGCRRQGGSSTEKVRLATESHCQQVSWTCPSLFEVPPSFFIGRLQTAFVQSRNKERNQLSGHRDKQTGIETRGI